MASSRQRWYDQEPACARVLEQIHAIHHPEIQDTCGRIIIHLAERIRKLLSKSYSGAGLSSMGPLGLSSLYRFGQHSRRWYDTRPTLLKAVSVIYRLPPQGLSALGYKLGDTFGLIQIYANVCTQLGQEPTDSDIIQICKTAFQDGPEEAEDVLANIIGKELYDALIGDMRSS